MTMTVTPEEVWNKANEDVRFLQHPEPTRQAVRKYIEALPEILKDDLDKKVTLNSLLEVKMKSARYTLDNGYAEVVANSIPAEELSVFTRDDLCNLTQETMEMVITMLEELMEDIPRFLKENEITEEQVLLSPKVGFHSETFALYKSGELTIGKLLLIQPMLIFMNNYE